MDSIELIRDERKHSIAEMLEFNRRLDRLMFLYVSAAYAIIGLRFSGKFKFEFLSERVEYSWFVFLFVFLNSCIMIHGISLLAWGMSRGKFIHVHINEALYERFQNSTESFPFVMSAWDRWYDGEKALAVMTRTVVVTFWITLILGSSVISLTLVDIMGFIKSYPIYFTGVAILFFTIKVFLFYAAFSQLIYTYYFQKPNPPHRKIKKQAIVLGVLTALILFVTCFLVITYA